MLIGFVVFQIRVMSYWPIGSLAVY